MAITYQGAGTAAANTVAATSLSVAYPTGITAGDVIVLAVGCSNATAPTNPSGFTSGVTGTSGGSSPAFRISYKVATGSESGSLSVATPSSTSQGRMFLFRGVDQTTPIDVTGTTFGSSTATAAYNLPTLTTTTTGVTLVWYGGANAASGTWTSPTVPAAFTKVWDALTATPRSGVGYLIWSGSGATGTVNLVSSSSVRGMAGLIALRPAGSSPTNVDAPASTATAAVTAPVVSGAVEVTAPAATATGSTTPPAVTAALQPPAATATGGVTAPTVTAAANVTAPPAGGTAGATAPTRSAAVNLAAPAASAVAAATAPTTGSNVNITTPAAGATAATGHPAVGVAANVTATAATATGAITAPNVGANVTVTATAATATAATTPPAINIAANIAATTAGATAGSTPPTLRAGVTIGAPGATAAGTVETPAVTVAALVLATAGTATATTSAPALSVHANIEAAAALATASMGDTRVYGFIRDIPLEAVLERSWRAVLVERDWDATTERNWKASL